MGRWGFPEDVSSSKIAGTSEALREKVLSGRVHSGGRRAPYSILRNFGMDRRCLVAGTTEPESSGNHLVYKFQFFYNKKLTKDPNRGLRNVHEDSGSAFGLLDLMCA